MTAIEGSAERSSSMRGNRGAISASTTALRTSAPRWAACVSCSCDQDSHGVLGEEVEQDAAVDERAPAGLPAGERQDLLGGHLALAGATHAADLLGGPVGVDQ